MADAVAIISRPVFEKLAGKSPALGVQHWMQRYDSTHPALDTLGDGKSTLFLVTVRPGGELWLVQSLSVLTKDARGWAAVASYGANVDLTPVLEHLDLTRSVARDKLAMSLQTPRALTPHDARLFTHANNESASYLLRKKVYTVKFAKWLLADAKAAGEPPPAKPAKPAKPSAVKPKTVKPLAKPTRGPKPAKLLVEAALGQLDEVLGGEAKPAKLRAEPNRKRGLRGHFTETVQSIFAGAIDDREAHRLLREELAPFVDGPALALALAEAGSDLDDLVDQFAIRAIDDLARALLALALDRPADVPASCASFGDALATYVPRVAELLG